MSDPPHPVVAVRSVRPLAGRPFGVAVLTAGLLNSGRKVSDIAGGVQNTCTADSTGRVAYWGLGPLGDGTGNHSGSPVRVVDSGLDRPFTPLSYPPPTALSCGALNLNGYPNDKEFPMSNKKKFAIIGAGAAAAVLSMGAVTMAMADDGTAPSPSTDTSQQAGPMGGPSAGETPRTGTEAEKVTAAAETEIPGGTVIRVETDSEGVYEAHVRKADGTEVIVQVGEDFTVTAVQEMGDGTGHRGGPGMNETPLTGADAEKATAAAQAEVPGGTVLRVETDADGTYEAHVRKADGTEVEVKMDENFTVTGVEEHAGMRADEPAPSQSPSA